MTLSNIAWAVGLLVLGVSASASVRGPAAFQQEVLPDTNAIAPEMVNAGRRVFRGQGTCAADRPADVSRIAQQVVPRSRDVGAPSWARFVPQDVAPSRPQCYTLILAAA
jgi:hypothetical protein